MIYIFITLLTMSVFHTHATESLRLYVEVSCGELVDKITILEIKRERIRDHKKVYNVQTELAILNETLQTILYDHPMLAPEILALKDQLHHINTALWDAENVIRAQAALKQFGETFTDASRAIYINNDMRSKLKATINHLLCSYIIEEKEYVPY